MNPMKNERTPPSEAVRSAETASLLLALVERSGNTNYLDAWGVHIKGPGREQTDFPEAVASQIRDEFEHQVMGTSNDDSRLVDNPVLRARLFNTAFGYPIAPEQQELLLKEMGLPDKASVGWQGEAPKYVGRLNVLIIGAGLSGVAMAIQLKKLGIPFTVLERNNDVGGTWLVNDYPGCGVDIASHCYSYSQDTQYEWNHYFARQPQILAYLKDCARKRELLAHIRFQTTVMSAAFDEDQGIWSVVIKAANGEQETLQASVVVSAVGQLSTPYTPNLPGMESFEGEIVHSAKWNHDVSVEGKKVLLVGGGASGIQIGPTIAPKVAHLTVLQRSPHWMVGVPNYHSPIPEEEKWLLQHSPVYARWIRARTVMAMTDANRAAVMVDKNWSRLDGTVSALNQRFRNNLVAYIREQLGDRQDLIDQVTPTYPPFVKRMLRDTGWYSTLLRENVTLITSGMSAFTRSGVIDQKGNSHDADVVIFATGFQATRMLGSAEFVGRGGRSIRSIWGDEDPFAYLGMAVPGFPNFFVMYGPNTNIATGGSLFFNAECQASYISQVLKEMIEGSLATVEIKDEICRDYNEKVQQKLSEMVWSLPDADSWYRNSKGKVVTNTPWSSFEYWQLTRRSNLSEYKVQLSTAVRTPDKHEGTLATEIR